MHTKTAYRVQPKFHILIYIVVFAKKNKEKTKTKKKGLKHMCK